MGSIYKNRFIINQRGGSIDIDNTTEQEKIKLSHRSGSNINLTNVVTSELATNNKQTNVVNDLFETVGNDKSEFTVGNNTVRTGKNSYTLKGFISESQLLLFKKWKEAYAAIAKKNSKFKIRRGGQSYPNGVKTQPSGYRSPNPSLKNSLYTVENKFKGYTGVPYRNSSVDEVVDYAKVTDKGPMVPAQIRGVTVDHILKSAGTSGSNAPGVVTYGASISSATESGVWTSEQDHNNLGSSIQELHKNTLLPIEQEMGDFGDDITITKRNKFEQVGAEFNDFPSVRIDEFGRSQPLEVLVADTGPFKNHDYVPHVEEVDNSSNFPCGNDDKIVGNRYSRVVGSGGIQLKTTGGVELGGTNLKIGANRVHINAAHGVQISSESFVELQSVKTITLRTNRQVYVESSLGVKNNLIVGGGAYIEGEVYVQHVTAPLEVHQTEDTTVYGKFATDFDRRLVIGETNVFGIWFDVYAKASDDLIVNYPHSHHHNGIPMRLTTANEDVRKFSQSENINSHNNISQSLPQTHERKRPQTAS